MASQPLQPAAYTARELTLGGYAATALWLLSGVLLLMLAAWSLGPR